MCVYMGLQGGIIKSRGRFRYLYAITAPLNILRLETALRFLAFQGYLVHHIAHLLCRHLGINLCGGNVLVP